MTVRSNKMHDRESARQSMICKVGESMICKVGVKDGHNPAATKVASKQCNPEHRCMLLHSDNCVLQLWQVQSTSCVNVMNKLATPYVNMHENL